VEFDQFLSHLRSEGAAAVDLAGGDLEATIPCCPGWSVRDAACHLAQVYEHKIACTELGVDPSPWPPDWPTGRDLAGWLGDAHLRLLALMEQLGPSAPSATWYPPDQTVGFWARRMAHETAVHRVDLQMALGCLEPVPGELAVDGVDEILTVILAGDWSAARDDHCRGQRVLVSTAGRDWLVTLAEDSITVSAATGKADAVLQGDPSDLVLWLWGRRGDEGLVPPASRDVLALLRGRLQLATQ